MKIVNIFKGSKSKYSESTSREKPEITPEMIDKAIRDLEEGSIYFDLSELSLAKYLNNLPCYAELDRLDLEDLETIETRLLTPEARRLLIRYFNEKGA